MPSLAQRLRDRITREGPISFREFMEAALYDTEGGYYAKGARIGERGDFVTSPHVSLAFASVLARRFLREFAELDDAPDFVEVGSGDGRFLQDFAAALAEQDASFAARVRWTAVEASAASRQELRARKLPSAPLLLESAEQLRAGSIRGWIFSNELFDALPVVRIEGSEEGLLELRVGTDPDRFVWTRMPASPGLEDHLTNFGIRLAPGQVGEIAPDAAPLYRRMAAALERGRILTFDYGHRAPVLYHPAARRNGTLTVHFAGLRRGDPLAQPGEVDLTAHVNWDDLIRAGESEGLRTVGVLRQGRFLAEAGLFDFATDDTEKWRAYRLVDPEGMGEELSVLEQERLRSARGHPARSGPGLDSPAPAEDGES